jgi:hypothetical protein
MLLSAGPSESGSAWRDLETLSSPARPLRSRPERRPGLLQTDGTCEGRLGPLIDGSALGTSWQMRLYLGARTTHRRILDRRGSTWRQGLLPRQPLLAGRSDVSLGRGWTGFAAASGLSGRPISRRWGVPCGGLCHRTSGADRVARRVGTGHRAAGRFRSSGICAGGCSAGRGAAGTGTCEKPGTDRRSERRGRSPGLGPCVRPGSRVRSRRLLGLAGPMAPTKVGRPGRGRRRAGWSVDAGGQGRRLDLQVPGQRRR